MLDNGADPSVSGRGKVSLEQLALYYTAARGYTKVVALLLEYGIGIEERQDDFIPFIRNSMARFRETTYLLLSRGADPNAQLPSNRYGPLNLALAGDYGGPRSF